MIPELHNRRSTWHFPVSLCFRMEAARFVGDRCLIERRAIIGQIGKSLFTRSERSPDRTSRTVARKAEAVFGDNYLYVLRYSTMSSTSFGSCRPSKGIRLPLTLAWGSAMYSLKLASSQTRLARFIGLE